MRLTLGTWFATTMTGACLVMAEPAHGAEPEPALGLEVDVSALPQDEETEGLRWLLVERQTRILRDGGIAVAEEDDRDAARIRVTVSRYGEGDVNYRFTVKLLEGGATTVERTLTCDLCRDTELVTKVGEEIARVSGRYVYEHEAGAREPEPNGRDEGNGAEPVDSGTPTDQEARPVGAAGYAGIAALVAGAGVTVGGVILLTKKPEVRLSPEDRRVEEVTTHRRLGTAFTAVGAGVLAAGVVLVVVDQTVLRKRRAKRHAVLHPSVGPNGVGLSLTGRF